MANSSPLRLPLKAVGKVMTMRVPIISIGSTVEDAENLLRKNAEDFDAFDYIYITNTQGKLAGILPIKILFKHSKSTKITEIMTKNPITINPHIAQERAAYLALKNNVKAVPVVDESGLLLGTITSHEILRILYDETQEDLFHSIGVGKHEVTDNILTMSLLTSLKHRLPWLIIGLVGGMLTAGIVSHFEVTLAENLILAAFIPMIVYMGGAVKDQMQVFIIRDYATNPNIKFKRYFLKQIAIILCIAMVSSFILFGLSLFLYGNLKISNVLGIGLFCSLISTVVSGLAIPYFFIRLKSDPANASGPISSIIQDIIGVLIYFGIAALLI
jgi:magnesium transporter